MTLTPEQKEHALELIEMGDKLQAVRYLKETLFISAEQALALAEKLEKETMPSSFTSTSSSGVNVGRLVGSIFMGIGGLMLAVVAYLYMSNRKFEQRAQHVKGKVIEYTSYESKDDDRNSYTTMYTPIFEYSFNGNTYKHKSSTSSSDQDYGIGEIVEVLVDPQDPQHPLINSFPEKWLLSVILGVMGFVFGGMGYLAYRLLGKGD